MTEAATTLTSPWERLGYKPVGYVRNKIIARYLRTQRKNMRRFFEERGLFALADRMKQIRASRQGMMAKNRMFQEVLNEYSQLANPTVAQSSDNSGLAPGSVLQSAPPVIAGETDDT